MPREVRQLFYSSLRITLCILIVLSIGFALFWPAGSKWQAVAGLFWGAMSAFAGFAMICRLAASVASPGINARRAGTAGYTLRYGVYAILLLAGVWMHLPVIAMLCGIVAQKASLIVISQKQRKDST